MNFLKKHALPCKSICIRHPRSRETAPRARAAGEGNPEPPHGGTDCNPTPSLRRLLLSYMTLHLKSTAGISCSRLPSTINLQERCPGGSRPSLPTWRLRSIPRDRSRGDPGTARGTPRARSIKYGELHNARCRAMPSTREISSGRICIGRNMHMQDLTLGLTLNRAGFDA